MAKAKLDKDKSKQVDKVASEHAKVRKQVEDFLKQSSEIDKALKKAKDGQVEMMELQQMYQQQKKAADTMATMLKKQHENAMKTINNMKG